MTHLPANLRRAVVALRSPQVTSAHLEVTETKPMLRIDEIVTCIWYGMSQNSVIQEADADEFLRSRLGIRHLGDAEVRKVADLLNNARMDDPPNWGIVSLLIAYVAANDDFSKNAALRQWLSECRATLTEIDRVMGLGAATAERFLKGLSAYSPSVAVPADPTPLTRRHLLDTVDNFQELAYILVMRKCGDDETCDGLLKDAMAAVGPIAFQATRDAALEIACTRDFSTLASSSLRLGAAPTLVCADRNTIAHKAACGSNAVLGIILEAQHPDDRMAMLTAKNVNTGDTILHVAASYGNADGINTILQFAGMGFRSLLQLPNKNGWTPIHCAADANTATACDALLKWSASPDPLGPVAAPILIATRKGEDLATVSVLLDHGATLTSETDKDLFAYDHLLIHAYLLSRELKTKHDRANVRRAAAVALPCIVCVITACAVTAGLPGWGILLLGSIATTVCSIGMFGVFLWASGVSGHRDTLHQHSTILRMLSVAESTPGVVRLRSWGAWRNKFGVLRAHLPGLSIEFSSMLAFAVICVLIGDVFTKNRAIAHQYSIALAESCTTGALTCDSTSMSWLRFDDFNCFFFYDEALQDAVGPNALHALPLSPPPLRWGTYGNYTWDERAAPPPTLRLTTVVYLQSRARLNLTRPKAKIQITYCTGDSPSPSWTVETIMPSENGAGELRDLGSWLFRAGLFMIVAQLLFSWTWASDRAAPHQPCTASPRMESVARYSVLATLHTVVATLCVCVGWKLHADDKLNLKTVPDDVAALSVTLMFLSLYPGLHAVTWIPAAGAVIAEVLHTVYLIIMFILGIFLVFPVIPAVKVLGIAYLLSEPLLAVGHFYETTSLNAFFVVVSVMSLFVFLRFVSAIAFALSPKDWNLHYAVALRRLRMVDARLTMTKISTQKAASDAAEAQTQNTAAGRSAAMALDELQRGQTAARAAQELLRTATQNFSKAPSSIAANDLRQIFRGHSGTINDSIAAVNRAIAEANACERKANESARRARELSSSSRREAALCTKLGFQGRRKTDFFVKNRICSAGAEVSAAASATSATAAGHSASAAADSAKSLRKLFVKLSAVGEAIAAAEAAASATVCAVTAERAGRGTTAALAAAAAASVAADNHKALASAAVAALHNTKNKVDAEVNATRTEDAVESQRVVDESLVLADSALRFAATAAVRARNSVFAPR